MTLSRPRFVALYLLGAEVFALKWGSVDPDPASDPQHPRGVDGGGATGSHELGFGFEPDAVVAKLDAERWRHRPC